MYIKIIFHFFISYFLRKNKEIIFSPFLVLKRSFEFFLIKIAILNNEFMGLIF